jgi:oxepin-CoA hydrolase/3-oxo-5,6-dehydrosuberyl-CoA semialdehyde dehydrogenase
MTTVSHASSGSAGSSARLAPIGALGTEPRLLGNYVNGAWVTGTGKSADLFHAVTGAKIGEASTGGIDFASMVEYAKTVGGPALRKLTFHERALQLKAMAQYLMARKDEFYLVSAASGATKQDSWIDIEGGIGTFYAYASRGRRDFPN